MSSILSLQQTAASAFGAKEEHIEQLPAEVKVGWEALTGYLYMEVSINGKSPITGWFVMGNPMKMDDMGYAHGLDTSICQCSYLENSRN